MTNNLYIAELLLRLFAATLFIFQGYDKLFRIKIPGVVAVFTEDAERNHIAPPFIKGIAWYTSVAEFFGGLLLLAGFMTNYALYALGLDIVLVGIAFSYVQPVWDMKYVFPRFMLLIVLLLLPPQCRFLSLDHLLNLN